MLGSTSRTEIILTIAAVLFAGTAPNLFVIAQAGYAGFSTLGKFALLPSLGALIIIGVLSWRRFPTLGRQLAAGSLAGILATLGLEAIREVGFHLGAMPGDLPKLMGVQLLNRFMAGPSLASNLAGWGYHFFNGASFGIIFALLVGRSRWWTGLIYGILIGVGFMASPAVTALGIGRFGVLFGPGFAITVTAAHLAFGATLGVLLERWLKGKGLIGRIFSYRSPTYEQKKPWIAGHS